MTIISSASVDLTTLFKSCVKTIKTRNKAIGIPSPKSSIFPKVPISQFFNRAKDILDNICSHDNLLSDHRKKYLIDDANSLSEIERCYMDKVLVKNLKFIEENIRTLEVDIKDFHEHQLSDQRKECYLGIIHILRTKYLKTNATFREMKDIRLKRQKEKEQLFRLQRPCGAKKKALIGAEKVKLISRHKPSETSIESIGPVHRGNDDFGTESNDESLSGSKFKDENENISSEINSSTSQTSYLEEYSNEVLTGLSEDERQLLEQENDHLYQELMSNHDEVKQITRQVVELSRMQDMLTENVEIQAQQIEEIHETILHSTDNVQRGNEEVREAMRKDAGFRVWIMFFLIVMSFTILFLDWYNP